MAVGWKMTRQIPIFPPHSASIRFHPFSRHTFGGDVVSQPTENETVACKNSVKQGTPRLNRIACNWGDVHVDAARNEDNLLYFCKILRINELHGCN